MREGPYTLGVEDECRWWLEVGVCVVEGGEARPYIPRDVTKLADLVMPLTSAREVGRGSALLLPSVVVFVSGVLFVTLLLYDTVEDFILREAERVSRGILEEREAVLREEPGRSSSTGVQGNEHIPDEDEAPDDVSIPRPLFRRAFGGIIH